MPAKKEFIDGVCEKCSYTGIAGELCPECHTPLVNIAPEVDRAGGKSPDEPETYPLEVLEAEEKTDDLEEQI